MYNWGTFTSVFFPVLLLKNRKFLEGNSEVGRIDKG
jgi:hypothetical protein